MFLPCTSIWRPVKLNTSWKNCLLLIILTLSSNRGWEGEGCVEEGFCLQLRDGDGDAEASRHIGVQVGLRCASESSTPACSCLHLHARPTTDALRSSLPAGHEAVGGEGDPGRHEEDEEGGEGDGDHPVQGVNVQWPGLATSKLILPDSSLCDLALKDWGRSAEWICVAGRAVWVFLKRSFPQLVKCKSKCSLVNRRHFFWWACIHVCQHISKVTGMIGMRICTKLSTWDYTSADANNSLFDGLLHIVYCLVRCRWHCQWPP